MTYPVSEDDLHAYVDGELDSERRQSVERYLAEHPEAAERVRDFASYNRALHQVYDRMLDEPLPIGMARPRQPSWRAGALRAAAAVALLVVGVAGGWWGKGAVEGEIAQRPNIAARAAVAHAVYSPEDSRPVEVDGENEEHLVDWLSRRVGEPLKTPKLVEAGYRLVGGRLVPGTSAAAAFFMYENESGNRITLYARARYASERKTALRHSYQGDIGVFYWTDERLSYAVSGQMTRDDLQLIAKLIRAGIDG